jgi:prepilin-type N-terminal cleavage/methylation domain-containing protein/prepilin-type processing-associated H-X9-DG protein
MRSLRSPRGFTLMEMAVVIGVVSLLVSIVFPYLRKAREHARRIQCTSNLRQIGVAFHVYFERATETGGTAYAPNPAAGFSGRAKMKYPVDSDIVAPVREMVDSMYPGHDHYAEANTFNLPGGRYWQTLGDGDSILYWDLNLFYPDLWGGVAGEASMEDADGARLCGTGEEDGFGFQNRILNAYAFMGNHNMTDASKAAEIFRCPGDASRWREYGNSYAANLRASSGNVYNDQGQLVPFWAALNFTNVDTVRSQGRTLLAGDAGWMRAMRGDGAPWLSWHGAELRYNLLFLDGHVQFLSIEPGQQSGPGWTIDAAEDR